MYQLKFVRNPRITQFKAYLRHPLKNRKNVCFSHPWLTKFQRNYISAHFTVNLDMFVSVILQHFPSPLYNFDPYYACPEDSSESFYYDDDFPKSYPTPPLNAMTPRRIEFHPEYVNGYFDAQFVYRPFDI
ncbi:unnamed protein product [Caenorhabditis bovis]|uniref:Uncharacterized protein n=1 Tax=Caenorhabditis bovis TaxID=2654633 RepID=A0A8S1EEF0_9PELO|nr:unnamed protein product [Caenorhabditis bovis]